MNTNSSPHESSSYSTGEDLKNYQLLMIIAAPIQENDSEKKIAGL
jgi:hypothetical protein